MISVIIPAFKVEKYLPQCLESVIGQTYRDLDIILVDDGSPDRCPEICDEYAARDQRITVIHQKNAGLAAARNAGLKVAKGEYVGFVDSDDWIAPSMYERMSQDLQKYQADVAICGYEYCDEDGNVDEKRRWAKRAVEILTQKEFMKRTADIPPSVRSTVFNKLFRRDFLNGVFFQEDLLYNEDVQFLAEYVMKIKSAVFVHEPLYNNRVRKGSATHGGANVSMLADSVRAHDFMHDCIVKTYPELRNYSQRFLLDVCLLEYNMAKSKIRSTPKNKRDKSAFQTLVKMRKHLKEHAWKALFNPEIYWKTRLAYLLVR